MIKNKHVPFLTFILSYIIVHIIYNLTGFKYSFSDGLNPKMLTDLALWIAIYAPLKIILHKVLLSNEKQNKYL